jgi:hypothetical protein
MSDDGPKIPLIDIGPIRVEKIPESNRRIPYPDGMTFEDLQKMAVLVMLVPMQRRSAVDLRTYDSTGKQVRVGSRVRFRGRVYTIKAFGPPNSSSRGECRTIEFEESPVHVDDVPDEWAIDLVTF